MHVAQKYKMAVGHFGVVVLTRRALPLCTLVWKISECQNYWADEGGSDRSDVSVISFFFLLASVNITEGTLWLVHVHLQHFHVSFCYSYGETVSPEKVAASALAFRRTWRGSPLLADTYVFSQKSTGQWKSQSLNLSVVEKKGFWLAEENKLWRSAHSCHRNQRIY